MSVTNSSTEDRRRAIVRAATELFVRYGYRRTSVDLIAQEAKLAKATIYAYFDGKESIFLGVCEEVCASILREAEAAAALSTIEEQVSGILAAKFTYYFALVQSSPHASELIRSHDSLAAEIIERADRAYLRLLGRVLSAADEAGALSLSAAGLSANAAAELLLRCGYGASYDAKTPAAHKRHLAEIVRAVLRGMRA